MLIAIAIQYVLNMRSRARLRFYLYEEKKNRQYSPDLVTIGTMIAGLHTQIHILYVTMMRRSL